MNELKVQPSVDTVHDVCLRISKLTQIPVQRQKLLCKHIVLRRDGRTLAEHGVKDGSKLHLVTVHREALPCIIGQMIQIVACAHCLVCQK